MLILAVNSCDYMWNNVIAPNALQSPDVWPCAALVFCGGHWPFLHEQAGGGCPPSEPSLLGEARLQTLPGVQAETCPDGCASPAAAIDNPLKTHKNKIQQWRRPCWHDNRTFKSEQTVDVWRRKVPGEQEVVPRRWGISVGNICSFEMSVVLDWNWPGRKL